MRTQPQLVGAKTRGRFGRVEEPLPSGDRLDVFFDASTEWVAVEVKPRASDDYDLTRGLYQCVKYEAVLRAMIAAEQKDVAVRAVLVLEGELSERLRLLSNILGVEVVERVSAR